MEGFANLLDEAVGIDNQLKKSSVPGSKMMLIEDCVETNGVFIIHHIIKRCLSHESSSEVVIFIALSHPFSHYDRILRKLGCNLSVHKDAQRFFFFDMLMMECPGRDEGNACKGGLVELYGKIQRMMEVISSSKRNATIVIDDFSLIEVATRGSLKHAVDFLHYCHSLTSEFGCSLVVLNHNDIYTGLERQELYRMEYLADVLIKVEPLATGVATDVHGLLTVINRKTCLELDNSRSKPFKFHFKIKENGIACFYPGYRT